MFVCMARLNVYVPDDLAEKARARGLNVSALTQAAIASELEAGAVAEWLAQWPADSGTATHQVAMAALEAARDEFGA